MIGSKQVPYIFLSKHLHCLLRGTDSDIKPDHLRCNSLLHWRKNGQLYCQGTKKKSEGECKRRTKRHRRECWTEEEKDSSEWNCETIRYRLCHGDVALTASCSSLCLSHVEPLLMEPSYPGWTSVMKVYSSYWIWRWNLCHSHSCSLAFILQPRPSCGGHIYIYTQSTQCPVESCTVGSHCCVTLWAFFTFFGLVCQWCFFAVFYCVFIPRRVLGIESWVKFNIINTGSQKREKVETITYFKLLVFR